jgi:hypothetical protein
MIIFFSKSSVIINNFERMVIALLFIFICIIGILFAFFPGWHNRKKRHKNNNKNNKTLKKRKGHHPNCEGFSNHVIKIKNKTYCAGCIGLAIGSLISVFLMILYLMIIKVNSEILYFFTPIGLLIIFFTYLEILIQKSLVFFHIFFNILLVISFFLITISIFEKTGSIFFGMISILLSFLFLDTRILLSSYKHSLICKNCNEECKMY